MFDIGWTELLLIGVIAILVVGPQELPRMMRTVGQYVGRIRAMARDFQRSFDEIARESELEELRKEVNALKAHNPVNQIKKSIEEETRPPIEKAAPTAPEELAPAPYETDPKTGEPVPPRAVEP